MKARVFTTLLVALIALPAVALALQPAEEGVPAGQWPAPPHQTPPVEIEGVAAEAEVRGSAGLFGVAVESGKRTTTRGDRLAYDLYIPQAAPGKPAPPWPAVVLNHGFARDKKFHARNARYLAERGVVVLTPNLVSLLGGARAQLACIADTRDHVAWLKARAQTPGDRLYGLVAPERIALAGHSAGGAVAFEAAEGESGVRAVVLLDAVPWDRTIETGQKMTVRRLASLRSEPSGCNMKGNVRNLLAHLGFESDDVRLARGTHCDPENPTDIFCRVFCEGTDAGVRALYQRLFYLFVQDALEVPSVEDPPDSFEEAIRRGVQSRALVVEHVVPKP